MREIASFFAMTVEASDISNLNRNNEANESAGLANKNKLQTSTTTIVFRLSRHKYKDYAIEINLCITKQSQPEMVFLIADCLKSKIVNSPTFVD